MRFDLARRRASIGKAAAAATVLALSVAPANAAWVRGPVTDPDSGDVLEGVLGQNEAGFSLALVKESSGGVRAIFRLPARDRDFLDAASAPRLALDGGPGRQVPVAGASLTWVTFPVWNGSGDALTGLLREIMQAERLGVTYFLYGGGYKETTFELAGAREAIAEAFGLRGEVPAEELARAAAREEAILDEAARCAEQKGRRRERCLEALRACAERAVDAEELRECLASGDA